jgi:hypothetical protein
MEWVEAREMQHIVNFACRLLSRGSALLVVSPQFRTVIAVQVPFSFGVSVEG